MNPTAHKAVGFSAFWGYKKSRTMLEFSVGHNTAHGLVTGRSASLIDPIAGAVFDTTPFTLFLKSTS